MEKAQKDLNIDSKLDKKDLIIGVRPEHIRVTNPENSVFRGTLNLIGSLGSEIILYIGIDR